MRVGPLPHLPPQYLTLDMAERPNEGWGLGQMLIPGIEAIVEFLFIPYDIFLVFPFRSYKSSDSSQILRRI